MRQLTVIGISIAVAAWLCIPWPFGQKPPTKPQKLVMSVESRLTALESEVRNLKAKLTKHEAGSLPHISSEFFGGK